MIKRISFFIFTLMMMVLLTGCDFIKLTETTQPPELGEIPAESGTVRRIDTYTFEPTGDSIKLGDLAPGEKAVIAITPIAQNSDGVGAQYTFEVIVEEMATSSLAMADETDDLPVLSQTDSAAGDLVFGEQRGQSDYRRVKGAFTELTPALREDVVEPMSNQRQFWVSNADDNYFEVTATKVAVTDYVNIYLDDDFYGISDFKINKVAAEMNKIYDNLTHVFGEPYWLDHLREIDLLITDLDGQDGYTLAGYFDERNYYPLNQIDYTNECEMIYLNGNLIKDNEMNQAYATIAHELQHLLFFSNKQRTLEITNGDRFKKDPSGCFVYDDTWINEGFAVLAPHLNQYSSLAEDLRIYSKSYGYFAHTAEDGLLNWNNKIYEYGSAGLFAYYLYDHYGYGIIKTVLETADRVDIAIEKYTGVEFAELLGNWMVANRVDRLANVSDPKYRYQDLVLKSQPVGKTASLFNRVSIWGNGVQYLEVDGAKEDLEVSIQPTRVYHYIDQLQVSVMIIAP